MARVKPQRHRGGGGINLVFFVMNTHTLLRDVGPEALYI